MAIYRKMDTVYTTGCWNVHKITIIIIINEIENFKTIVILFFWTYKLSYGVQRNNWDLIAESEMICCLKQVNTHQKCV